MPEEIIEEPPEEPEEMPVVISHEDLVNRKSHFNKILKAKEGELLKTIVTAVLPKDEVLKEGDEVHISILVESKSDSTKMTNVEKAKVATDTNHPIIIDKILE